MEVDPLHGGDQRIDNPSNRLLVGADPVGAGEHGRGWPDAAQGCFGSVGGGEVDGGVAGTALLDGGDGG